MFASTDRRFWMRNAFRALIIALVIPLTTVATPAHADGTLTGTIRNTDNDLLTNVEIDIYTSRVEAGETVWDLSFTTFTDENGFYSIGLVTGQYRIGFVDLEGIHESEFYNNVSSVDLAANVNIGSATIMRNAQLAPKGWIGGTVRDEADDPINEVDVVLYQYFEDGDDSYWMDVAYTQTDTDGNYQIYASPGTYRVGFDGIYIGYSAEYYDDVTDLAEGTDVTLTAGVGTEAINATLDSRGLVSGHVTDADNPDDALAGINVSFYANNGTPQLPIWEYEADVQTDENGYYEYYGANPVRVGFDDPDQLFSPEFYDDESDVNDATTLDLAAGGPFTADAALSSTGSIAGTVTDTNEELQSGIEVDVYENVGTVQNPQWEVETIAYTDGDGNYAAPVSAGTYRVGFFGDYGSPVYYDAVDSLEAADDVVVDPTEAVTGIDAVVASATETLTNTVAPKISGTAKVGSTLKVSPGSWSTSTPTFSYTWLASGVAIPGADSTSLKLTGAQVNKRITVLVTASAVDAEDGDAVTAATAKVVVKPTMKLTDKVKRTKVILKVAVSAAGVKSVAGKVKIFRKSKLLKTVKLKSGSVKVKLTKQPKGKAKYSAKYLGSGPVLPVKKTIKVAV